MIERHRPYRVLVPQGKVALAREIAKRTQPKFIEIAEMPKTVDDLALEDWERRVRQWLRDEK